MPVADVLLPEILTPSIRVPGVAPGSVSSKRASLSAPLTVCAVVLAASSGGALVERRQHCAERLANMNV